jgi:hypothetical protein
MNQYQIPMNRAMRRAAFAKEFKQNSNRSKPYRVTKARVAMSVMRGRRKIEEFINRGLKLNAKVIQPRSLTNAIRKALWM